MSFSGIVKHWQEDFTLLAPGVSTLVIPIPLRCFALSMAMANAAGLTQTLYWWMRDADGATLASDQTAFSAGAGVDVFGEVVPFGIQRGAADVFIDRLAVAGTESVFRCFFAVPT